MARRREREREAERVSLLFKQNGNTTETRLTFGLQLTVMDPVMDQMNKGCNNGRWEQAATQQSYLTFPIMPDHDTHSLSE